MSLETAFKNLKRKSSVLAQTAGVLLAGLVFGLVANAVSPRGLRLSRDYFPGGGGAVAATGTNSGLVRTNVAGGAQSSTNSATVLRLRQKGLQAIDTAEAVELFNDPLYQHGIILFVDARNTEHFQAGHIPGAHQFDHYHAEQFLPSLLPICTAAQKVVVYCTGGECEDSEFAAITLAELGVPKENIFVYTGGITEWKAAGHKIETGAAKNP